MRRQQDGPSTRDGAAGTAAPPADVIRLVGVTKAYQGSVTKAFQQGGRPALADVSMTVAAGEVAAIMGPSGSGKSTLLNVIAGLDRPTSGSVTVAGQRIDTMGESALARFRARHVGIIFQFFNLLEDLTVADNVLLPAQLAGVSRRRARVRAAELLERLGLEGHRGAYPARLSGGQRQRVAIARALVNSPELLLADEPTGALDTATGQEIGRLLSELNAAGQTLVIVTHDQALAARYAARTITIVDGQLTDGQPASAAVHR
jgi:putative ABC transport system ATP-binding protein